MVNITTISWTDFTINFGGGCKKVSEGCDNCYSERGDRRWGRDFTVVRRRPQAFADMFALSRKIGDGHAKVFLNSMTDTFHPFYDDDYIAELLTVAALTPNLTYQILTKRYSRLRTFLTDACRCKGGHQPGVHLKSKMADIARKYARKRPDLDNISHHVYFDVPYPLPNVWFGVSAETQYWADRRIPSLLSTPAAVRFVSAEPLLGPIHLNMCNYWAPPHMEGFPGAHNPLTGEWWPAVGNAEEEYANRVTDQPRIDWVIVGGESGFGDSYRPMDLTWARDVVAQCQEAGTAVFVKQLGTAQAQRLGLADFKGEKWGQWPSDLDDLRIRQFPTPLLNR
ncbi:DUF5131 family protein [Planobispora siamensis]|uniref:Protein gp37 n=1 Tax=Planobispora siamensis TaxID=936338 RepID=A0A8J3SJ11_9ACTN|nr:DUF5131 family protein [Planobispora siamensis]GIH95411.1 hypothetical protein Psi01_60410 [Planobispora siamensis]